MGARRAAQLEDEPEQAPAPADASLSPAPPPAGFSPQSLSRAGVIALQRLVGNAAVAEMIDAGRRPRADEPGSGEPDSDRPGAGEPGDPPAAEPGQADPQGAGESAGQSATPGEAVAGGDEPLGAIGAGLVAAPGVGAPLVDAGDSQGVGAARDGAGLGAAAGGGAAAGEVAAGPGAATAGVAATGGAAVGAADAGAVGGAAAAVAGSDPAAGEADVRDPHDDPGFQAMKGATRSVGAHAKTHQPAAVGAATAQGAALPPGNDAASQAAAAQVDEMGKREPGVFDKKAFVAAVKQAIDNAAPKNLEEAGDFKGSGKVGKAKEAVQGLVKGGKKESEKSIKEATDAPPDTSKAKPKPVTPMVNDVHGPPPPDVGAAGAMPKSRPAAQTDLSQGPAEVDKTMADADVTKEQIEKSNEPEFTGALAAHDVAKAHSATAPAEYRGKEQAVLQKGHAEAEGVAGEHLVGIHGARGQALGKAVEKKTETKTADETKRAKVASDIQGIYDLTKTDVTKILTDLDSKVDDAFTSGEKAASTKFENDVGERMSTYKDDRYGGLLGPARWIKDKFMGLPDEVNRFYEQGRTAYLAEMDGVIGNVADIVGRELTAARARIATGRAEVQKYVAQLPADLQEVGKEAAGKLEAEFDKLSSDVDDKQTALVDALAKKYVEARDKLDAHIGEMKEANKGFVAKARDAIVGVVQTIMKLKDMLMNVLSKAAGVIGDIIKDPIGFLGNLIDAVKGGVMRFGANIGEHLQEGLMGWLFGALGSAGITMPKSLDFAGILDLVTQVLGLTWQNVRMRVAKAVGEPLMAKMEQTVDVFKDFASAGIAGAWKWIKDKIGDLEDLVIGQIKEFVESKIVQAGITWIVSLLNPAGAFIRACKAIYDIVMFIVERGSQIMEFVNSIIDSIGAIAKGGIGAAVEKIEGALSKALPLAISFLASLLGLGGISEKIRSIIDKVRSPINKAIDVVVGGAVKTFKKMFSGAIGWAKGKVEKGKEFVKGKVEAGKEWAKGKVEGVKDRLRGKPPAGDPAAEAGGAGATKDGSGATKDGAARADPEPVVRPFSMQGTSHELTLDSGPDGVHVRMASPSSATLISKVTAEKETQQGIIDALPSADIELIRYHTGGRDALQEIVDWYQPELARINGLYRSMGVAAVAPMLRQLGDALIVRIVQVSAKYRLEDFAKRTFDIAAHLQTIENTVEKSIEKHKTNKDAKGDGMAYTAAAAEVYLGWVHPGGERHITKVADGVISLERELQELDKLHKNGIDMSGERYYVRGRNVLELCKRAQQDPSGFLWERGYAVIKDFVDDMQANGVDGNVRVVDDVRRRLGMAPLRRKA